MMIRSSFMFAAILVTMLMLHGARAEEDEAEDKIGGPGDPYCEHGDCYEYLGIETDATGLASIDARRWLGQVGHERLPRLKKNRHQTATFR